MRGRGPVNTAAYLLKRLTQLVVIARIVTLASRLTKLLTVDVFNVTVTQSWERIMYEAAFKSTHGDASPDFKLFTRTLTTASVQ